LKQVELNQSYFRLSELRKKEVDLREQLKQERSKPIAKVRSDPSPIAKLNVTSKAEADPVKPLSAALGLNAAVSVNKAASDPLSDTHDVVAKLVKSNDKQASNNSILTDDKAKHNKSL
jgi:hypothetical protein